MAFPAQAIASVEVDVRLIGSLPSALSSAQVEIEVEVEIEVGV